MRCAGLRAGEEPAPTDEPGSDWGDEAGVFSDRDSLSDWGGTDDEHSRGGSAAASPARRPRALPLSSGDWAQNLEPRA